MTEALLLWGIYLKVKAHWSWELWSWHPSSCTFGSRGSSWLSQQNQIPFFFGKLSRGFTDGGFSCKCHLWSLWCTLSPLQPEWRLPKLPLLNSISLCLIATSEIYLQMPLRTLLSDFSVQILFSIVTGKYPIISILTLRLLFVFFF